MVSSFVGPMPAFEFLRKFMKFKKKTRRPQPRLDFSEVQGGMAKGDMCQHICRVVNESKLSPRFRLVTATKMFDANDIQSHPDIAGVSQNLPFSDEKMYNLMDFWLDVRADEGESSREGDFITHMNKNWKQMGSYTAAVMSRQHRTFMFSISICDHFARFYRWDRSGCTASELVDLYNSPEVLAYFLLCYGRLSATDRGFDPTVETATLQEANLLRKAIAQFGEECKEKGRRNVTALQKPSKLESPWSAFIVQAKIAGSMRRLIIGRPFSGDSDSPFGRATKAYLAYDLTEKRLVFLKDSWRKEDAMMTAEGIVYEKLQESEVPFLPVVLSAEDVKHGRKIQKTVTQMFANAKVRPKWLQIAPSTVLKTYVHYRVVQEIVFPLVSATSSRVYVQAIRDAIVTIKLAYETGKLLHRDISAWNIMISSTGRGVLNDWDHALGILLCERHPSRTGTWQFLSIGMLAEGAKIHEIQDDLESCYWVLLYISFHYFQHSRPHYNIDFFDESSGRKKSGFLMGNDLAGSRIHWTCTPLNNLLHELTIIFQMYQIDAHLPPARARKEFLEQHALIGEVDVILQHFDRALASNEWPENDALEDQRLENPIKFEVEKEYRNTVATIFVTGNDGNAPALSTPVSNVEVQHAETQTVGRAEDDTTIVALHDDTPLLPSKLVQPRRYSLRPRANVNIPGEQQDQTSNVAPRYVTRSRVKLEATRGPTKEATQPRKNEGRSRLINATSKTRPRAARGR